MIKLRFCKIEFSKLCNLTVSKNIFKHKNNIFGGTKKIDLIIIKITINENTTTIKSVKLSNVGHSQCFNG
jgi:hypothetical protein